MRLSNSATVRSQKPSPDISAKVEFLRRPEIYGGAEKSVEVKETHFSFIFLTNSFAWKLKKPVCYHTMDFRSLDARKMNCEEEMRLNSRISPHVYLGIVALTLDENGKLHLEGEGAVVDWLVKMRRLPDEKMLDQAIRKKSVSEEEAMKVGNLLADFYQKCDRPRFTPKEFRDRLRSEILATEFELLKSHNELGEREILSIARAQLAFLRDEEKLFDDRVTSGRIVEAHGDLRPEHICLNDPPAVIDCLEFDRELRIMDAVSELSFLALECDRLGDAQTGEVIFKAYLDRSGDRITPKLRNFYRSYHAFLRTMIAIRHLEDNGVADRARWQMRARQYLKFAEIILTNV